MNAGGDTADQAVKMTLEGIEVVGGLAVKAGGAMAKSLAATLYAILTDQKKVRGKTRLETLLRSNKELKVFAIRSKDLETFVREAKKYGVLYSVIKEKNNKDGICDIMVRAEDAAKISRIVDRFELATINTRALRESIIAERDGHDNTLKDVQVLTDEEHDHLVESLMNSTFDKSKDGPSEKRTVEISGYKENPFKARTENRSDSQFEHSSKKADVAEGLTTDRKSVRKELSEIKKELSVKDDRKKSQQRNTKKSSKNRKTKPKRKVR